MTTIFKRKGHKSDPGNYRPVMQSDVADRKDF